VRLGGDGQDAHQLAGALALALHDNPPGTVISYHDEEFWVRR